MSEINVDTLIADLESRGLGWDVGYTGMLREVRIWRWPFVVGRYRPSEATPLADMLAKAMYDVDFEYYTKLAPGEEIKPYHKSHER